MISFIISSLIILFSPDGGHENPSLLSVNPGLIIWTIIIFILLLFLLRKIAWKPLITALNNRELTIKNSLEYAEKLKAETEKIKEENDKIIEEAKIQAKKIISQSKEAAERVKQEIISKANLESQKIIMKAKEEIELQRETMIEELKQDIIFIAIKAAEKIIENNLNEKKHSKLIEEFISKLPKN